MRPEHPRAAALAQAAGAIALLASLWLPWYQPKAHRSLVLFGALDTLQSVTRSVTAWRVLRPEGIVLAIIALLAVVSATALPRHRYYRHLILASQAGLVIALILIVYRLVSPPHVASHALASAGATYTPRFGAWVAAIGAAGGLVAALLAPRGLPVHDQRRDESPQPERAS